MIFDKGVKATQWRHHSLFKKWCWENWIPTCKRMKLDSCLTVAKINSKWITIHFVMDCNYKSIKLIPIS